MKPNFLDRRVFFGCRMCTHHVSYLIVYKSFPAPGRQPSLLFYVKVSGWVWGTGVTESVCGACMNSEPSSSFQLNTFHEGVGK